VNYRSDGVSAQMPIIKSLREGFQARKNSGLSLPESIFFVLLAFLVFAFFWKTKDNLMKLNSYSMIYKANNLIYADGKT